MATNTDLILRTIKYKRFTVYDIYIALGKKRAFYYAIEENRWSKELLDAVGKIIGEDLSSFVNN